MKVKKWYCFVVLLCTPAAYLNGRSILRNQDLDNPAITVSWVGSEQNYRLESLYLEERPFFNLFDKKYLLQHQLPRTNITFRNEPTQSVKGSILNELIVNLIEQEIKAKKKRYTNFTVLQDKGFNRRNACGLIILKFNDYPFVLKLFIETPESFIDPWAKGIEPIFFFYMGGGVNRHLSGFMRLKNLEFINKRIAADPHWSKLVETPRKWFWVDPHHNSWLSITGNNLGGKKVQKITIPGTYAIIADAIKAERTFSSLRSKDMQTALELSNFLEANIDLHITNFMVEATTKKIVLIDTEHFPTMVGNVNKHFDGYLSWYLHLMGKFCKDAFLCSKKERRDEQYASAKHPVPSF